MHATYEVNASNIIGILYVQVWDLQTGPPTTTERGDRLAVDVSGRAASRATKTWVVAWSVL